MCPVRFTPAAAPPPLVGTQSGVSRCFAARNSATLRASFELPLLVSSKTLQNAQKPLHPMGEAALCGVPGKIRTPGLLIRSQTLYPAELRAPFARIEFQAYPDSGEPQIYHAAKTLGK